VIESTYHSAIAQRGDVVIDFSECYYIDQEGIRWLAAIKARRKAAFVDRRSSGDRRGLERPVKEDAGDRRGENRRRREDRRRRTDI
jgi:hypothetical protein